MEESGGSNKQTGDGKESGEVKLEIAKDIGAARKMAGEELGHTIVSGKKIVIDPATGRVSLEDDPPAKTAKPAEPIIESPAGQLAESAPVEQVPVEALPKAEVIEAPPAADAAEVEAVRVEAEAAKVEPVVVEPVAPEPKAEEPKKAEPAASEAAAPGNKRLSAETLFAFALPEAVVSAADDALNKMKTQSSMPAPTMSPKDSTTVKQTIVNRVVKGSGKTKTILVAATLILVAAVWFLFGRTPEEITTTKEPIGKPGAVDRGKDSGKTGPDTKPSQQNVQPSSNGASANTPAVAGGPAADSPAGKAIAALGSSDARAVETAVQDGVKLKDDAVNRKILSLVTHPTVFVRVAIAKAFADRTAYSDALRPSVVTALSSLLEDSDYLVRGYAARALGTTKDKSALPKLTARLDTESEEVVKKLLRSSIDQLSK